MLHTSSFHLGPRLTSTSWNLHRTRTGMWSLSETRFYEEGDRVYQMPQPSQTKDDLDDALALVPPTARAIGTREGVPSVWVG